MKSEITGVHLIFLCSNGCHKIDIFSIISFPPGHDLGERYSLPAHNPSSPAPEKTFNEKITISITFNDIIIS